jgi:hypothetical protein
LTEPAPEEKEHPVVEIKKAVCFGCGKTLGIAEGTLFDSPGGYGSALFDPLGDIEELNLYVCDPCLLERADRVNHITVERRAPIRRGKSFRQYLEDEGIHTEGISR